ncbi:hypothetical protein VCRA2113O415_640006 [Vibrio crassostreae]|nr:hypothetical protein VCRA2113O415_640006 [Vibrio crassostreae]CAK2948234.1 hypothetical protein VCRA2113O420_600006 [Vibrio crassostreae]CAK3530018.1 hypothetical protein VCRA2121O436_580006 [Vibrio crassostreae]
MAFFVSELQVNFRVIRVYTIPLVRQNSQTLVLFDYICLTDN